MTPELIQQYGDKVATTSIEVQIGSTSGTYPLPDDSILRDKVVVGLFVMSNGSGTAKSPMNRALASEAAVNSSYLTLKFVNDDVISSHPLSDFRPSKEDRSIRRIKICGFNPSKSFIKVADPALIAAGQSIVLQFIYLNE